MPKCVLFGFLAPLLSFFTLTVGNQEKGRIAVVGGLKDCGFSTDELTKFTWKPDKRIGV